MTPPPTDRYALGVSVALGDLRSGLLCALVSGVAGAGILFLGGGHIARDEASRLDRARAAGERA